MKIKKEMHPPESTSTPGSGGKAKYSENIVLQDLEEDIEKTLSSEFNETTSDDSDMSDSESDKPQTPTQQTAIPKESKGSFIGSEVEVRSLIYTFITTIQNIKLESSYPSIISPTKNFHR